MTDTDRAPFDLPTGLPAPCFPEPAGPHELDPALLDLLLVPSSLPPCTPVDWRQLNADDAAAVWDALDDWVRWLARRYGLDHRELPGCWHGHGDLVEELTALHTAHHSAYRPDAPATAPIEWHQHLAATRARLHTSLTRNGCRPGEHRPTAAPPWANDPPPADYAHALAAHVTDDLTARI